MLHPGELRPAGISQKNTEKILEMSANTAGRLRIPLVRFDARTYNSLRCDGVASGLWLNCRAERKMFPFLLTVCCLGSLLLGEAGAQIDFGTMNRAGAHLRRAGEYTIYSSGNPLILQPGLIHWTTHARV